jgi:heme/copper-type cytochrome/quinol oxidase subunit 1
MTRAIIQELLLFLLPFAAFAVYLIIRRRNPLAWSSWSDQSVWLVMAGLVFVIASLLIAGFSNDHQTGAFVPTHIENGKVVPGRFK